MRACEALRVYWCSARTFRASVDGVIMQHVGAQVLFRLVNIVVHVVTLCRAVEVDFQQAAFLSHHAVRVSLRWRSQLEGCS